MINKFLIFSFNIICSLKIFNERDINYFNLLFCAKTV